MKYVGITEYCYWEGETWTVFVREDDPNLPNFLEDAYEAGFEERFPADPLLVTESEAKTLVKYADEGYFPRYSFGRIAEKSESMTEDEESDYYRKLKWAE